MEDEKGTGFDYELAIKCETCDGKGFIVSKNPKGEDEAISCLTCGGKGKVIVASGQEHKEHNLSEPAKPEH